MQTNYLLKILLFMTMTAVSSVSALSAATNEDIPGCVSQSDKAGSIRDSEGASWSPLYYIKTNMLGWPCLWVNFEGETDFAPHWSAAIAVYYSGWDYFHRDTKFRTFSVMPEIRYWFQGRNDGFFMGAHCGASYYNIALTVFLCAIPAGSLNSLPVAAPIILIMIFLKTVSTVVL